MARPAISFDLCKERLYRRLEHHGIEVTKVMDEELCYIPMGGAMPSLTQVRLCSDQSGCIRVLFFFFFFMFCTGLSVCRRVAAASMIGLPLAGVPFFVVAPWSVRCVCCCLVVRWIFCCRPAGFSDLVAIMLRIDISPYTAVAK